MVTKPGSNWVAQISKIVDPNASGAKADLPPNNWSPMFPAHSPAWLIWLSISLVIGQSRLNYGFVTTAGKRLPVTWANFARKMVWEKTVGTTKFTKNKLQESYKTVKGNEIAQKDNLILRLLIYGYFVDLPFRLQPYQKNYLCLKRDTLRIYLYLVLWRQFGQLVRACAVSLTAMFAAPDWKMARIHTALPFHSIDKWFIWHTVVQTFSFNSGSSESK